jgi:hypothetical protein
LLRASLGDPWLAEAEHALEQLLQTHEPAPALVLDAVLQRMASSQRSA